MFFFYFKITYFLKLKKDYVFTIENLADTEN